MFPRPAWRPLPPPPGQDPSTAHDFESLAAQSYAGFDAAIEAHGATLALAGAALAQGQTALDQIGAALDAAASVGGGQLRALDTLDLASYTGAIDGLVSGVSTGIGEAAAGVNAIPAVNYNLPNFPAAPTFSVPQAPTLPTPSQGSVATTAGQVAWKIALSSQILTIGMGPTVATAWGPMGLGPLGSLSPVLAGVLPVITGFALGVALPLTILSLLGIDISGHAHTPESTLNVYEQPQIDTAVRYITESAHWWHPPENKPYGPGWVEYNYIYGLLKNAVCFLFSIRTYWDQDWVAGNLTKLAQAWTTATGRFPPDVSCETWPH